MSGATEQRIAAVVLQLSQLQPRSGKDDSYYLHFSKNDALGSDARDKPKQNKIRSHKIVIIK